ncbi:MAG: phytanoyl-CoA dioxygenase family protein, partial [Akkermansiaceae bacterium]|nr:phytanoyl-CoA dioxygenase family protein [Armatimonadota bacterium]
VIIPPALTEEQIEFYNREGYLVLPGLLNADAADAVRGDITTIMDVIGLGTSKLRQSNEYLKGSALDRFVNDPDLLSVAERLMGGSSTMYLPFTAVKSGNGGGQFHFHQDNQYTRFDGPGINLWCAFTPMTEENGCLKIIPRSHREGTLPSELSGDGDQHKKVTFEPADFVSVLMNPGDCVAFSRLTVHGSGPNNSPENRIAYAVQFHRNDVNYSTDGGGTFQSLVENPRWSVGPVEHITPPKGRIDGH